MHVRELGACTGGGCMRMSMPGSCAGWIRLIGTLHGLLVVRCMHPSRKPGTAHPTSPNGCECCTLPCSIRHRLARAARQQPGAPPGPGGRSQPRPLARMASLLPFTHPSLSVPHPAAPHNAPAVPHAPPVCGAAAGQPGAAVVVRRCAPHAVDLPVRKLLLLALPCLSGTPFAWRCGVRQSSGQEEAARLVTTTYTRSR